MTLVCVIHHVCVNICFCDITSAHICKSRGLPMLLSPVKTYESVVVDSVWSNGSGGNSDLPIENFPTWGVISCNFLRLGNAASRGGISASTVVTWHSFLARKDYHNQLTNPGSIHIRHHVCKIHGIFYLSINKTRLVAKIVAYHDSNGDM